MSVYAIISLGSVCVTLVIYLTSLCLNFFIQRMNVYS